MGGERRQGGEGVGEEISLRSAQTQCEEEQNHPKGVPD